MRTIIYAPSASGKVNDEELNAWENSGFRVVIWQAPYLKKESLESIDELRLSWVLYEYSFKELYKEIRSQTYDYLFAVGLNFGGAVLAYVSRGLELDGTIIVGAIPKLTYFWKAGQHPAAKKIQEKGYTYFDELEKKLGHTDLVSSVGFLPKEKLLIQVGLRDEWIDEEGRNQYYGLSQKGYSISWHNDGHALKGGAAASERLGWLFSHSNNSSFAI